MQIYWRARAKKDAKGNWQLDDENGGWRFLPVPEGAGRKPEWLSVAIEQAANGGRGFQFRRGEQWSDQYRSIEAAHDAAGDPTTVKPTKAEEDGNRFTVRGAVESYLNRKRDKKSDATVNAYTYILDEFISFLPPAIRFIDQVNSDILENYLRRLQKHGAAPKTIVNKVMVVCFMLKSAGMQNPSRLVELPTVEQEMVEPYTREDLGKLFAAMNAEETIRYRFFLDTACREKEVACARWNDIDWQKSEYIVRSKSWKTAAGVEKAFTTKNHKVRRVPLTRELVDMLRKRQKSSTSPWIFPNEDGEPEGHFLRKFKKVAYKAGLNCGHCEPDCSDSPEGCEKHYLHRLRKSRATFWHENGVSLRTIQNWLSHESLETTMQYLGIQDSAKLQKEINAPMY